MQFLKLSSNGSNVHGYISAIVGAFRRTSSQRGSHGVEMLSDGRLDVIIIVYSIT